MKNELTPSELLLIHLRQTLEVAEPPSPGDPNFQRYLDTQALFQQLSLAHHFQVCIDIDPLDKAAAANLLRSLSLVERSRSRSAKAEKQANSDKVRDEQPLQPDRDEARHFLQCELAGGERPAKELVKVARSLGISMSTLKRAKASLNIVSTQLALPDKTRLWVWSLPDQAPQTGSTMRPDAGESTEQKICKASHSAVDTESNKFLQPATFSPTTHTLVSDLKTPECQGLKQFR